MKVEVAVLGSPSLIVLRSLWTKSNTELLVSELRSCVKVEVDVMGSLSLIVRTVSLDVKKH